jgi:hypothetical protein
MFGTLLHRDRERWGTSIPRTARRSGVSVVTDAEMEAGQDAVPEGSVRSGLICPHAAASGNAA